MRNGLDFECNLNSKQFCLIQYIWTTEYQTLQSPVFKWSRHFETGQKCPVFKWFGSTDVKNNSQPFENRTKMSGFRMVNHHLMSVDHHSKTEPFMNWTHLDHSKTGLVRYSDSYCIHIIFTASGICLFFPLIWYPHCWV